MASDSSSKVTSERTGARGSGFSVDDLLTRIGSSKQEEVEERCDDVTTTSDIVSSEIEEKGRGSFTGNAFDMHGTIIGYIF